MTKSRSSSYHGETQTYGNDVTDIMVPLGDDFTVKLGDSIGANKKSILNSLGAEVAWIDSLGNASFTSVASYLENVVYVAVSGGDYTSVQSALTLNPTAGLIVLVAPGTYASTIDFTANYQSVIGLGDVFNTTIAGADAAILNVADYASCVVKNITLTMGATTTVKNNITVNDGNVIFENCILATNNTTAIASAAQPSVVKITGSGEVSIGKGSIVSYSNEGAEATAVKVPFVIDLDGYISVKDSQISVDGENATSVTALASFGGDGELDVSGSSIDVDDEVADYVIGSGYVVTGIIPQDFKNNKISVSRSGAGVADVAAFYASGGSAASVASYSNRISVTNNTTPARAYSFFQAGTPTINSVFDNIESADGGASGTVTYGLTREATQISSSLPLKVYDRISALGSLGEILLSDGEADSTIKIGRYIMNHYDMSEEPFGLFISQSTATANTINYGGGSALANAATQIVWYTAADNTTTTGTARLAVDGDSGIYMGLNSTKVGVGYAIAAALTSEFNVNGNVLIEGDLDVDNVEIQKVGDATALIPNQVSGSVTFTGAAWNGAASVDDTYSVKLSVDGGTEWLGIENNEGQEFLLIQNNDKAFTLFSRQEAGEDGIKVGSTEGLTTENVFEVYDDLADGTGGTLLAAADGNGNWKYKSSLVNTAVKEAPTEGSQLLANPDLENWDFDDGNTWSFIDNESFDGDGWFASDWGGTDEDDCVTPHAGTYAVVLENDDDSPYAIEQAVTGLTENDEYTFKIYAKYPDSEEYEADASSINLIFLNAPYATATQMWNNSSHAWEAIGAGPIGNNTDTHNLTTSWVQYTHADSASLDVPESGTINVVIASSAVSGEISWIDSATLEPTSGGASVLADGSFEDPDTTDEGWPGGFDSEDYIDDNDSDWVVTRSADSQSGTYAMKLTSDADGDSGMVMVDQKIAEEPVAGESFKAKVYVKRENADDASNFTFIALNESDFEDATLIYDWVSEEWKPIADKDDDCKDVRTLTGAYVEYISDNVTCPEAGGLSLMFAHEAGEGAEDESIFLDNIRAYKLVGGPAVTASSFENASDYSNMDATDAALLIKTTDGTGKELLRVGVDGAVTNGGIGFDFSGEAVLFDEPEEQDEPVPLIYFETHGVTLLGKTAKGGINLKSTGKTVTDFDMPDGYRLINVQIVIVTETSEALNVGGTLKVGNNIDADNIRSSIAYPQNAVQQRTSDCSGSDNTVLSTAGLVSFNLTVADGGTSGTATGYIFGTLIAT